jgi:hypothetical protein
MTTFKLVKLGKVMEAVYPGVMREGYYRIQTKVKGDQQWPLKVV